MLYTFSFFFAFSFSPAILAQHRTIDDLRHELSMAKHDTTKASICGLLAWELRSLNPKEAIALANQEIKIGKKISNSNYIAQGYRAKGLTLIIAEDMEGGLACYDSCIFYAKKAGNLYYESTCISLIGGMYGDLGDYDRSIDYYTRGLELAQKLKDETLIAHNFNNLAEIYQHAGRETKRIQNYYILSITHSLKIKDWPYAGMTSANLAKEYARIGKTEKAFSEIKRTLDVMNRDTVDAYRYGTTAHILSSAYNDLKEFELAKKYALISVRIMDSLKRPDNALRPLTELTKAHIALGNLVEGKKCAERLIQDGFTQNAKLYIRDGYKALSEIAKLKGDFANALVHFEKYKSWNDSVFELGREQRISNVETRAQVAQKELEIKYESEKKKQENRNLENQNQSLRRSRLIVVVACIIFIFLITLLYFANRKKNAINQELILKKSIVEKQAKENELLVHEIHHRVKNNLTMLKSMLFLQAKDSDELEVKRILQECQLRIQSMAIVHTSLYGENKANSLNFPQFLETMLGELLLSFSVSGKEVEFEVNGSCKDLTIVQAIPLGLIMNELITNSLKYAFTNTPNGQITINIREENNKLCIYYIDSGPGLKNDVDLQKGGFGFKLINILVKQLDAQLSYAKTDNGSSFTIVFKY